MRRRLLGVNQIIEQDIMAMWSPTFVDSKQREADEVIDGLWNLAPDSI